MQVAAEAAAPAALQAFRQAAAEAARHGSSVEEARGEGSVVVAVARQVRGAFAERGARLGRCSPRGGVCMCLWLDIHEHVSMK